jgi:hypothetical protein
MPSAEETVRAIVDAPSWDKRVAQARLVTARHGTDEHPRIWAEVAREAYVPYLAADFAFVHSAPFYEAEYFREVYHAAEAATEGFSRVTPEHLTDVLVADPRVLLALRTVTGLTKEELAHSTFLTAQGNGLPALSAGKIDAMEKRGTTTSRAQAETAARTVAGIVEGSLFPAPEVALRSKQQKLDTAYGWHSVEQAATEGVSYSDYLHQRHYGGAYRQILDATSTRRGDAIEDAVDGLFTDAGVPHIRTGSHNQAEIADRFEVQVTPAPDFVVFDDADALQAMLECKITSDGGTARDKALRFERLREEARRLGGIPLLAVLGGMGWARVNDTLGPVVRDTDGRVFTQATLAQLLDVAPFPTLRGLA